MPRTRDALEFRRWALDFSPSVLKRKAVRQWEKMAPEFGKRVSPFLLERWRAGLFGEESDKERQQYDDEFRDGILNGTLIEELIVVASWSEKLSDEVGVPVVCDRPPYEVLVDHAHLFDILPHVIRKSFGTGMSDSDLNSIREAMQKMRDGSPPDLITAFTSIRPLMDRAIPILLRATEGYGIHNEFVRHWIVFNARMARRSVDARDRAAARQSIVKVGEALSPSPWVGEGPNELGLAVDYRFIRQHADSILRKKYHNANLKQADLHAKLSQFERSLINKFAHESPRKFALELLSARYRRKPGYLWNLIKRGNLYVDIIGHWRAALLSTEKNPHSANSQHDVTPSQTS